MVLEKAKKQQVPNDIITRAIEKAKGVGGEDYTEITYEGFGPGASTLIIKTLTDNVNRTVGEVRAAFNKVHKSLGVTNSVSYSYDYLGIISFKSDKEEEIFERFKKLDEFIPGTGLGLSICRLIVERLGGKVSLDPAYTQGARFVITL